MDNPSGTKRPRGKPTYYPGKIQKSISGIMTQASRDELYHCYGETGVSVSDLLEHAWRAARGLPLNPNLVGLLAQIPNAPSV